MLVIVAVAGVKTKSKVAEKTAKDLPRVQSQGQREQMRELLVIRDKKGRRPAMVSVRADARPFILNAVTKALPKSQRHMAYDVSRIIITEANHHKMDPLFLLAVIATESGFNPKARGLHGEIGLMQVLPKTAVWIAPKAGIPVDKIDLEDPVINIRIGATYFARLRKSFDGHGPRYVAAYNMGSANVRKLVRSKVEPKIYSGRVLENYENFRTAFREKSQK